MSVIFMAGWPKSGKSYIVAKLLKQLKGRDVEVVCPRDYLEENFEQLEQEDKRANWLAAWRVGLDHLEEQILNSTDDDVLILDTAAASAKVMQYYFTLANKKGHTTVYLFVTASKDMIKQRSGEEWNEELYEKYRVAFDESIPVLRKEASKAFILNNENEPNIDKIMKFINK